MSRTVVVPLTLPLNVQSAEWGPRVCLESLWMSASATGTVFAFVDYGIVCRPRTCCRTCRRNNRRRGWRAMEERDGRRGKEGVPAECRRQARRLQESVPQPTTEGAVITLQSSSPVLLWSRVQRTRRVELSTLLLFVVVFAADSWVNETRRASSRAPRQELTDSRQFSTRSDIRCDIRDLTRLDGS